AQLIQPGAAAVVITVPSMAWPAEIATSLSQFANLSAGCAARISAKFRKLFYLCSMRTWQPRGRERDELRGSFLPPNGNAGGNRARGRQSHTIKISVDSVDSVDACGSPRA